MEESEGRSATKTADAPTSGLGIERARGQVWLCGPGLAQQLEISFRIAADSSVLSTVDEQAG